MFVRASHVVAFGFCVFNSVTLASPDASNVHSNACLWQTRLGGTSNHVSGHCTRLWFVLCIHSSMPTP